MKKHLQRNWWKYLAVIILPVIVWTTVFSLRSRPDSRQRLRILYVGEGLNTAALQADLQSILPSLTSQTVKEITVTQEAPVGMAYGEWLISRQFSYDILIFSEPWCTENIGRNYFSRMTDSLLSRFPSAAQYCETVDGRSLTYALVLCDGSVQTRFCEYLETEKTPCFLFFSPESDHLGAENGKGEQTDGAAIAAAQYLSEEIH